MDDIEGCTTLDGDLTVVWVDTPGAGLPTNLDLSDVMNITGSVSFSDRRSDPSSSVVVKADSLNTIGGSLNFTNMGKLERTTFLSLNSVQDIIFDNVTFTGNSSLGAATFPFLTELSSMTFTNTSLTDIGAGWGMGFSAHKTAQSNATASFEAVDNPALRNIDIPGYESDFVAIHIEGNDEDLTVTFTDVTTCTLDLQGVGSFNGPNIQRIGSGDSAGTATIKARQESTDLDAYTNLITNNSFAELSFPNLVAVADSLNLSNNTALERILFPQLNTVGGSVMLSGEALKEVEIGSTLSFQDSAQLVIESDDQKMCSALQRSNPEIQCQSVPQPIDPNTDGSQTDDDDDDDESEGSSGLSNSVKIGIGLAVGLGVPLLLLIAFLLYRYRTRQSRAAARASSAMNEELYTKRGGSVSEQTMASSAHFSKMTSSTIQADELPRPVSPRLSFGDLRFSSHDHDAAVQRGERFEMEEQQRMRHEMDARSLRDMDLDSRRPPDRDRRSLEDIERERNSGPPIGVAIGDPEPRRQGLGPVSPIGDPGPRRQGHGPVSPIEGEWF